MDFSFLGGSLSLILTAASCTATTRDKRKMKEMGSLLKQTSVVHVNLSPWYRYFTCRPWRNLSRSEILTGKEGIKQTMYFWCLEFGVVESMEKLYSTCFTLMFPVI